MIDVYNQKNEKVGTVELPERIFGAKWNPDLVHQALRAQISNSRINLAHAKGRSEVSGGGKKPWRQKGTGRARHGSIRSPLWKGGGVTHGPTKEENFSLKINKKMRQAALFSVLSRKLKEDEIKLLDSLVLKEPKTKLLAEMMNDSLGRLKRSALLVPAESNKNIYRASRNIPGVKSLSPKSLNVYDLMKYKNIVFDKDAVAVLEKHFNATQ